MRNLTSCNHHQFTFINFLAAVKHTINQYLQRQSKMHQPIRYGGGRLRMNISETVITKKPIWHFKQNIFSIPHFNSGIHHFTLLKWGIHFWHWFPMLELPSKRGRNWKEEEEVNSFTLLTKSENWLPELRTNSYLFRR